jgi:L-asparaginase/Glu-tRNA(Gln) amidotransferase subunit D
LNRHLRNEKARSSIESRAFLRSALLTLLCLLATLTVAQTKPVVVFIATGGTIAMKIDPVKHAPLPAISGSDKPVVLIGAQRNASESGFDGPRRLLNAVRIAVDPQSEGKGALLAMNSQIKRRPRRHQDPHLDCGNL